MEPGLRAEAVGELLRQLAIGLSTYRLYPGDLAQPALHTSAEKVGAAFEVATATGPVDAIVRGGRFHVDGHTVDNERVDRLAEACFARRIEYLSIERRPTVDDLGVFFDALATDDDVATTAGVDAVLDAGGVRSIVATAGSPSATGGEDQPAEGDPATTTDDRVPLLHVDPDDTATTLYDRARAVSATLDDSESARSTFYRRVAELVATLDPTQQTLFGGLVLDRIATDPFAERYAGHLTDPEIAELLAAVADLRAVEAVELTADFARRTGRQRALVTLVAELVADAARQAPAGTVGAVWGDHGLRDEFPADDDEGRRLALDALADYLRADAPSPQLEAVATAIVEQLRRDLGDAAVVRIKALLAVLDDAADRRSGEARAVLRAVRRRVLTPATLDRLVAATGGDARSATEALQPFGAAAVDGVVAALGAGDPRSSARMRNLLAELVRHRPAVLRQQLERHTWQVASEMTTVLRTIGGAEVVPVLEHLAHHDHAQVRHQARQRLAELSTVDAARALARVVPTLGVRSEQRQGIDALARSGASETPALLRELSGSHHPDRLPWLLRRRARRKAGRWAPA